ncbi:MAG: hypothetical protein JJU13_04450 [Balneolaceae bacterium]|nr:hypothetical protein [Balneolaceae bacterium]
MPQKPAPHRRKRKESDLSGDYFILFNLRHFLLIFLHFLIIIPLVTGCYHYRVIAPDPEPATEYEKRTVHSLFWGLMQARDISADDCLSNALDEVRITTNLGYSIVSVATLGIWMPMDMRWRCAKEPLIDGEI